MRACELPMLLKVDEVAGILRTTKKAIYSMIDRGQLPGIVRVGRRVFIASSELVDWLRHDCTPSREVMR